jgi:hypothetical protein
MVMVGATTLGFVGGIQVVGIRKTGKFASYYDPVDKVSYSSITGGAGDRIAQHSTDRDNSPWNLGYWLEKNLLVRAKMKTVVYHLN